MTAPTLVEKLSPLEAYRADLSMGAHAGSASLAVAAALWDASRSPAGVRDRLRMAAHQAAKQLDKQTLKRGCSYDSKPSTASIGILRLAAQETELAGYLTVAGVMLESLATVARPGSSAAIHVSADRARNARKRGRYDLAQARAEHAMRAAKHSRNPELVARAHIEFAGIAQARGNYPEVEKHGRRALTLGQRVANRRIAGAAHIALGIRAAMGGSFDVAVTQFWNAYELARPNEVQFIEAVSNLAQVALDTGHACSALRIARHGLSQRIPLQYAFALLGTAVLAAASEGNVDSAIWATQEVQRLAGGDRHPREAALALAECWEAHTRLRRLRTASLVRTAAVRLATTFGLPEISHRLEQKLPEPARQTGQETLRPPGIAVLSAVGEDLTDPIHVALSH